MKSHFDLYFHATGQLQFHQGIDGLGGGAVNIQQTFVRTQFELLARFLIHVRRTQHGEYLLLGRERNGSVHYRAGGFDGLDDLVGRLVHQTVVIGLEFDTDF